MSETLIALPLATALDRLLRRDWQTSSTSLTSDDVLYNDMWVAWPRDICPRPSRDDWELALTTLFPRLRGVCSESKSHCIGRAIVRRQKGPEAVPLNRGRKSVDLWFDAQVSASATRFTPVGDLFVNYQMFTPEDERLEIHLWSSYLNKIIDHSYVRRVRGKTCRVRNVVAKGSASYSRTNCSGFDSPPRDDDTALIAKWFEARCEEPETGGTPTKELYHDYREFGGTLSDVQFGTKLTQWRQDLKSRSLTRVGSFPVRGRPIVLRKR